MPSLLLVVFVLQLLIYLVNSVGAPVINEFLWTLYNKLPTSTSTSTSTSADIKSQSQLARKVLQLKRELNATSAQDQFAKWAKLDREHNRAQAKYDEKANSLKDFKLTFDRNITFLRWGSTNGLRFFLQFWYAKRPLFWIPRGWVPRYVEWILAFPRAPTGSVSVQMWGIACATVMQLVGAAVVAGVVLWGEYRQGGYRQRQGREKGREKMAMGAGVGDGGGRERKKEL